MAARPTASPAGPTTASRSRPWSCAPATPTSACYEGEIEKLSSAESQGVGIRVIRDHRQGFAYAGTLRRRRARRDAGRGPRQRRVRRRPTSTSGWPSPTASRCAELDLYRDALDDVPHRREDRPGPRARAGRPRRRPPHLRDRGGRLRRRPGGRRGRHAPPASGPAAASTSAYLSAEALATEGDETQTGFGFSVGRDPATSTSRRPPATRSQRATRMLGAKKPKSERLTIVLDPYVTAQFLGVVGGTLSAEAVLKGRSLFADRVGEEVGVAAPHARRRPDRAPGATPPPQTDGEGLATRRNPLIEGGVLQRLPPRHATRPGAWARASTGVGRAGLSTHAVARLPGPRARPRRRHAGRPGRRRSTTGCSCRRSPGCTRASTR